MGWFESSYMARRGMAKGQAGTLHRLTEAVQGKYHYVYGPYAEPVLRIRPGDRSSDQSHNREVRGPAMRPGPAPMRSAPPAYSGSTMPHRRATAAGRAMPWHAPADPAADRPETPAGRRSRHRRLG